MSDNIDYSSKSGEYFNNVRHEMIPFAPAGAQVILDVGCGNGTFLKSFKNRTGAELWGIEYVDREAQVAKKHFHKVFSGPCEKYIDDLPDDYFDAIYFNDVLEHLIDPYTVLEKIRQKLKPHGVVISSIPNIRSFKTLMKLVIKKDWKYTSHGIMDRTHMRFFTKKSIRRMYEEAGYVVKSHQGINRTKSVKPWLLNVPLLFTQMDTFYLQFATVAGKK